MTSPNGPPANPNANQCEAMVKGTGERCKKIAIAGSNVCASHGGAAPQVRNKAAMNVVRQNLFQELSGLATNLGTPIYSDPVTILYDLIAMSAGHVAWYRAQIERLLPDALIWTETAVTQGASGRLSVTQEAEVNKWVDLYNAERKFLADISTRAIAAGLAEREIRLEEERGRMMAETMRLILADLHLTPDQSERAIEVVPLRLREITRG